MQNGRYAVVFCLCLVLKLHVVCFDWTLRNYCWCFQVPVSRMYRKRRYRLFRPRYDWTMIRDQVGETAYGNAVSSGKYLSGFAVCRGVCLSRAIGPSHFHPWWSYIICLQYLEIEVKNPRTHIENEKAQYTDYEIELKVRTWFDFVAGRVNFTGQFSPLPQIRGLKFLVHRSLKLVLPIRTKKPNFGRQ